jgi:hypothetical protein
LGPFFDMGVLGKMRPTVTNTIIAEALSFGAPSRLDAVMRDVVAKLQIAKVTPHDDSDHAGPLSERSGRPRHAPLRIVRASGGGCR